MITAMVIVVLVATLAAGMMWQQWRAVQVESAERSREESYWILQGALDWARLILREDAKSGGNIDHLGEPWATPLAEARLSSFLAADHDNTSDAPDAFLSGAITDAQSRYNLRNLIMQGKVSPEEFKVLTRLCAAAGVPQAVAQTLADQLQRAADTDALTPAATATPSTQTATASGGGPHPLMPQQFDQLRWLGLDQDVLDKLRPFITILPVTTAVNINTAPKEVLAAVIDDMDLGTAQRLIDIRRTTPLKNINEASTLLGRPMLKGSAIGVASSYFEVSGRLRLEDRVVEQRYLVMRQGYDVIPLYRQRMAGVDSIAALAPQH
jgi:general secretion pathway protein K